MYIMVELIGDNLAATALWGLGSFVVLLASSTLYHLLVHRRPSEEAAVRIRTACADASLDPRFVRVARNGINVGVAYPLAIPGLRVVVVSEDLLYEESTDRIAALLSVETVRGKLRYTIPLCVVTGGWLVYGPEAILGVVTTTPIASVPAILLLAILVPGGFLVVGFGYWWFTFDRGVDRAIDRVGPEATLAALDRARGTVSPWNLGHRYFLKRARNQVVVSTGIRPGGV